MSDEQRFVRSQAPTPSDSGARNSIDDGSVFTGATMSQHSTGIIDEDDTQPQSQHSQSQSEHQPEDQFLPKDQQISNPGIDDDGHASRELTPVELPTHISREALTSILQGTFSTLYQAVFARRMLSLESADLLENVLKLITEPLQGYNWHQQSLKTAYAKLSKMHEENPGVMGDLLYRRESAKSVAMGIATFNVCGMNLAGRHLRLVFDLMHAEDCNSTGLVSEQDVIDMAEVVRVAQTQREEIAEEDEEINEERSGEEGDKDKEGGRGRRWTTA